MMQHLGDITKLNGATIEPVWCVTGGSPCQDLEHRGQACWSRRRAKRPVYGTDQSDKGDEGT